MNSAYLGALITCNEMTVGDYKLVTRIEEAYLVTDEVEDVLASLRHLKLCLREAQTDPHAWKWVSISLFCAVQGAMVCHATGSAGIEALKREHATRELAWLDGTPTKSGLPPDSDLAGPDTLWKRLTGEFADFPPAGGVIHPSTDQEEAFQFIKNTRHWFSHFTPKVWLVGVPRIRNSIPPLLDLLQEMTNRGYAFRHGDREAFVSELAQIRTLLKE